MDKHNISSDLFFLVTTDFNHGFRLILDYLIKTILKSRSLRCHKLNITQIRCLIKQSIKDLTKLHIRVDGDDIIHGITSQKDYMICFVCFLYSFLYILN